MIPLSKLLKPHFLDTYLRKALDVLGSDISLYVLDDTGAVVTAAGPEQPALDLTLIGSPGLLPDQEGIFSVPLAGQGTATGRLVAAPLNGGGIPQSVATGVEFIAHSLSEVMTREQLRRALGDETLEQYRESALMQRAVINLNNRMKLEHVTLSLLDELSQGSFPAEYGLIFPENNGAPVSRCMDTDCHPGESYLDKFADTPLYKDILQSEKGEIINDLASDSRWNNEIPGITSVLIVPLLAPGLAMGGLVLTSSDPAGPFRASHLKRATTLASIASVAMANAHHFEQVENILLALINAMAAAIDSRDHLTAGHSQRVARFAVSLGRLASEDKEICPHISFSEMELMELKYAGLLHDIGKIGVREEVLTKATRLPRMHLELIGLRLTLWGELNSREWGEIYTRLEKINRAYELSDEDHALINRFSQETLNISQNIITILSEDERERLLTPKGNLTHEEWLEIQRHPRESYRILERIPFTHVFPLILVIIKQHHERLDGSGYPDGLSGDEILMQSRILAVVDVYDSLTRDRHYKKALSREMALAILQQEARENKLDKDVVRLFCRDIDRIERSQSEEEIFPAPGLNN